MKSSKRVSLVLLGICMLFLSAAVAWGQSSAQNKSKSLVNVDAQGVGAHGYDPIAFFKEGKAVKGDAQWQSTYGGAIYYFQSSADRDLFDKEPAKYAPQYGGYCAMAMTMGKLEDVDPDYFLVHQDKLLFQRNEKAHMMFSKDPEGNHKKADESWAKLQQAVN
jgi:YHS domain-containing protein